MTDRIKGLTVVLERDFREDDVEALINAILVMRGVKHVVPHVAEAEDFVVRTRTISEIEKDVAKVFAKARNTEWK